MSKASSAALHAQCIPSRCPTECWQCHLMRKCKFPTRQGLLSHGGALYMRVMWPEGRFQLNNAFRSQWGYEYIMRRRKTLFATHNSRNRCLNQELASAATHQRPQHQSRSLERRACRVPPGMYSIISHTFSPTKQAP